MLESATQEFTAPLIAQEPGRKGQLLATPDLNFLLIRRKARDLKPAREACREFSLPDELSDPVQSKGLQFLSLLSFDTVNDGAAIAPHGTLGSNPVLKPGALIRLGFRQEHKALEGLVFERIPQ